MNLFEHHHDLLSVDAANPPRTQQPPASAQGNGKVIELTILMPCLNEVRTLEPCIGKARRFLGEHGVEGEVLIADNGSTDGSQALARRLGARVIDVPVRGYGAALRAGIEAARGGFVIMGDADDSYDFSRLDAFLAALRQGQELVVGNRFRGGIAPDAMPWLHRYLGNPVLSYLGRRFFGGPLRDFHCGLRGFRRESIRNLHLVTPGMEFASEMIVKALQARLRVAEVPTTLVKDGRGRPPHLNTWRDGWRHLRYLLLYSPRWLFIYPGIGLALLGLLQLGYSHWPGAAESGWPVGIHTQLIASAVMVLGYQTLLFAAAAVLARHEARLDTPHPGERALAQWAQGPWPPLIGAAMAMVGLVVCLSFTWQWSRAGYGPLNPEIAMRQIIPGVALLIIGSQTLLAAVFFAAQRAAFDSSRRAPASESGRPSFRETEP